MIEKGSIFERLVRDGHSWWWERREVLDATETCVFYQDLYENAEGTCVERDLTVDPKQVTMKEWKAWANLARRREHGA